MNDNELFEGNTHANDVGPPARENFNMGSLSFKQLFSVNTWFYKKIKCVFGLVYTVLSTTMAWYEDQLIPTYLPALESRLYRWKA